MKIIGYTTDSSTMKQAGYIVSISNDEMIALMGASQTLNECIGNQIPISHAQAQIESIMRHHAEQPARLVRSAKVGRSIHAKPSEKSVTRHKICEICDKAFIDKGRTNQRKICYDAGCEQDLKRKWQQKWRSNKSCKAKRATTIPTGNPVLSDKQAKI